MAKSIKKNFGFNLVLTLCNYLFPLITYPYVSRVLGVENIGICNYVDSIVNYFALFSLMGIGSLGVREVARCKDDINERSRIFSNLIIVNVLLTILSIATLITCTLFIKQLQPYRAFLYIGIAKLAIMPFLIEWFFQGIQEFKYITIRSVIIRLLYIFALFAFVHSKEDVLIYYILLALQTFINSAINWSFSKKFVNFSIKDFSPFLYIVPILVFGYYRILASLYTSFNTFFLGLTSGNTEVGLFSTATKMNSIIMGVFTAFTTVMIPKVSEMLKDGKTFELQAIADKTFSTMTTLALPIIIYCWFNAPSIIFIIAGPGYEGAIIPFKIIIFLILIVGIEQIAIQQFLMASRNNKAIAIVSTVGAIVGLSLNFILTPQFASIGSSISWGCSETAVLIVGLILLKKTLGIVLPLGKLVKNFLYASLYIWALFAIQFGNFGHIVNLLISGTIVFLLFLLINMKLNRDPLITNLFSSAIRKIGYKK